jgi:hypothetical protein
MNARSKVWHVLGYNTEWRAWTIRSTHDNPHDALDAMRMLRAGGLRARVLGASKPAALDVKPAVNNATRTWRLERAGAISDLADAAKRYKSPG